MSKLSSVTQRHILSCQGLCHLSICHHVSLLMSSLSLCSCSFFPLMYHFQKNFLGQSNEDNLKIYSASYSLTLHKLNPGSCLEQAQSHCAHFSITSAAPSLYSHFPSFLYLLFPTVPMNVVALMRLCRALWGWEVTMLMVGSQHVCFGREDGLTVSINRYTSYQCMYADDGLLSDKSILTKYHADAFSSNLTNKPC